MDQQRSRLQEDLRGLVAGEVRCDEVFCQLYASDASIYEIKPLSIVLPRSTADVAAVVHYCQENMIPVHARGAGTGLAGESLGPGVVIDFAKHLRRVLHSGTPDIARGGPYTVRVQAGVVHERLNAHLRKFGRQFGPDPAMSGVTTMGSVIALDNGGSHWPRYGSARRHVVSLHVVLADGTVMEVGNEPVPAQAADPGATGPEARRANLVYRLAEVIRRDEALLKAKQPKSLVNRSGYQLADVLAEGSLNVARIIAGSAGTLALITEATLATQPLPRHRAVALLFFDRLDQAARAALEITTLAPSACDIMDRRHMALARESDARYAALLPLDAEALLLVECEGDNPAEVHDQVAAIVDRIRRKRRYAFDSRMAFDAEELNLFWRLALKVVPTLYRLKGSARAIPFVEDLAVPPAALPKFFVDMQNILKAHQVVASLFGHAGHGQLHLRPFMDLANADDLRKMPALAADLYEAVFQSGGTIAGEHGDGLSRTPFVRRQYGAAYEVFRAVKRIFDPLNILNPGKVIGDDPELMTRNLRPRELAANGAAQAPAAEAANSVTTVPVEAFAAGADVPERELIEDQGVSREPGAVAVAEPPTGPAPAAEEKPQVVELQLNWSRAELSQAVLACNGCGACRSESPDVRMCPIFRFAPTEEASPRAKANLLRGILSRELPAEALASDDFKAVADLCVNCQMCRLECPANVDIPRMMVEAKAAYVRAKGLPFSDGVLTRLDLVGKIGRMMLPFTNWIIRNRQARWFVEKLLGIAQGRKLPRFERKTFLMRAARRRLTRPTRRTGRKVLFFFDNYVNHFDAQLGEALVAVLEHNGVAVYVHPKQQQSGMAMISLGALDRARRVAAHNVHILAEAVRQGYTIVATEPSAVLCLVREYPALIDDDDARLVAENTLEACTYLWRLHQGGNLQLDFRPVNAALAYHMPCHLKALYPDSAGLNLLRLVPALAVQHVEAGCSGMAGTFGLKRENYRSSLRAGWPLISSLRQSSVQAGTTECSACKMQMEQGTTKPTIHPLKILALAYGAMPEAEALLTAQGEELVVT
ncbi:MAG: anaerobic glycerol-3-phosphate dehydrogenase subunit C [Planctomycetia bacterium]|nr:anaerobic glycerol-3-phosphate dehydrogenase subunit C [Planctomycetia bacterium]